MEFYASLTLSSECNLLFVFATDFGAKWNIKEVIRDKTCKVIIFYAIDEWHRSGTSDRSFFSNMVQVKSLKWILLKLHFYSYFHVNTHKYLLNLPYLFYLIIVVSWEQKYSGALAWAPKYLRKNFISNKWDLILCKIIFTHWPVFIITNM